MDIPHTENGNFSKNKKNRFFNRKRNTSTIDMTAMVDVAFLLLTFFVLSSTISQSSMMELIVPPKAENSADDRIEVLEEKVLTLILLDSGAIAYFKGITDPKVLYTDYSPNGIRKVILKHLHKEIPRCDGETPTRLKNVCWDPIIVIKPENQSRFKHLVDVLDELAITKAPKFAIDEFTETDSMFLTSH